MINRAWEKAKIIARLIRQLPNKAEMMMRNARVKEMPHNLGNSDLYKNRKTKEKSLGGRTNLSGAVRCGSNINTSVRNIKAKWPILNKSRKIVDS